MLVISRGCGSEICIDSEITIRIVAIHKGHVGLGIEAPSRVRIWRKEIAPVSEDSLPTDCRPLIRSQ